VHHSSCRSLSRSYATQKWGKACASRAISLLAWGALNGYGQRVMGCEVCRAYLSEGLEEHRQ
jgi:hypothetical protein